MDAHALAREFFDYAKDIQRARGNHVRHMAHGEMATMHYLVANDAISPSDLSRATGVSSARTANVLNGLEKKGWITRSRDPDDRRRIVVQATEAGLALVHEHFETAITEMADVLAGLGEPDATEYVRLTKRMRDLMVANDE